MKETENTQSWNEVTLAYSSYMQVCRSDVTILSIPLPPINAKFHVMKPMPNNKYNFLLTIRVTCSRIDITVCFRIDVKFIIFILNPPNSVFVDTNQPNFQSVPVTLAIGLNICFFFISPLFCCLRYFYRYLSRAILHFFQFFFSFLFILQCFSNLSLPRRFRLYIFINL